MTSVRACLRLLGGVSRARLAALAALLLLAALTDGIGILMLVPLLGSLGPGGAAAAGAGLPGRVLRAVHPDPGIAGILALFLGLVALRSLVQYGRDRLHVQVQAEAVDGLRRRCFAALLAVEWRWIVARRQSDHAALLLTDLNRVGQGLSAGLGLLVSLGSIGASLGAACALSPGLTLLAAGTGLGALALLAGPRRRALALGLLRHPALLVLDEATSALDWDNEARVRAALEGLRGSLTIVLIGHRLPPAALAAADQVLVLDAGRVRALGAWTEAATAPPGPGLPGS